MSYKCVSYFDKFDHTRKSSFVSPSGTPLFDQYEYKDIDGIQVLVKTKPINRQEEIDSYASSCDISNILTRFLNGETDLLHASGSGFYGDVSDMPTTYAEYFDRVKEAERIFSELPEELRSKYDSAEQFFTEFDIDKFAEDVSSVLGDDSGSVDAGSDDGGNVNAE